MHIGKRAKAFLVSLTSNRYTRWQRLITVTIASIPLIILASSIVLANRQAVVMQTNSKTSQPPSTIDTSNQPPQVQTEDNSIAAPPPSTSSAAPAQGPSSLPPLPHATENPTLAWYDSNSYLTDKFSTYAQQINSAVGGCSTTNPDYNSMCVDYDGSSVLPVCKSLLDTVDTSRGLPAIPYATANNYWQSALNSFQSAAQTCITRINAHQYVGSSTDVGYTIGPSLLGGLNSLTSMVSAITAYRSTL